MCLHFLRISCIEIKGRDMPVTHQLGNVLCPTVNVPCLPRERERKGPGNPFPGRHAEVPPLNIRYFVELF